MPYWVLRIAGVVNGGVKSLAQHRTGPDQTLLSWNITAASGLVYCRITHQAEPGRSVMVLRVLMIKWHSTRRHELLEMWNITMIMIFRHLNSLFNLFHYHQIECVVNCLRIPPQTLSSKSGLGPSPPLNSLNEEFCLFFISLYNKNCFLFVVWFCSPIFVFPFL